MYSIVDNIPIEIFSKNLRLVCTAFKKFQRLWNKISRRVYASLLDEPSNYVSAGSI